MPLVPLALVGWTWFVWGGRIRNALATDGGAPTATLALAGSFVVLAALLAAAVLRDRRGVPGAAQVVLTWILALWTTGVWGVRAVAIVASGDHTVGFVAVHVALAVVSIVLSGCAVTAVRGRSGRTVDDACVNARRPLGAADVSAR